MGYGKKDELEVITNLFLLGLISGGKIKPKYTPSKHECPFCHEVFEGVPKWCPHCRKRVTKPGTSELIER